MEKNNRALYNRERTDVVLVLYGGGLIPTANYIISQAADNLATMGKEVYIGFYSFAAFVHPDEYIKPWNEHLKAEAESAFGGFYGTSRGYMVNDPEFLTNIVKVCKARGITKIVLFGGDGTSKAAAAMAPHLAEEGIYTIFALPATIDGIEGGFSIGLDSATRKALEVLEDCVATNAQTLEKDDFSVVFFEVMGRDRDDILLCLLSFIEQQKTISGKKLDEYAIIVIGDDIGKVNIKLMKKYKVKLMKKFNIDFPITGNLRPAIGFLFFLFSGFNFF